MRRPGGRSQYPWQRRGSGAVNRFFGLCMRLPSRDGTEDGVALDGIVYPSGSSKSGRGIPGFSRR